MHLVRLTFYSVDFWSIYIMHGTKISLLLAYETCIIALECYESYRNECSQSL